MAEEIVEVNDRGNLEIPSKLIGDVQPHTRFIAEREGASVILRPENSRSKWEQRTPEQRARAFLEWARSFTSDHPPLPDSAISRESMYD